MNSFIHKLAMLALCVSAFAACNKEADQPTRPDDPTGGDKTKIWGQVTWDDGSPAKGIVVSDGFTCNTTDNLGRYQLVRNSDAYFVNLSLPSNAAVQLNSNGLPVFYQRITSSSREYHFSMIRQAAENNFRLIGIGDPQVTTDAEVTRFRNETVADMKTFVAENNTMPTYGITLGDVVGNKWDLFSSMRTAMSKTQATFPIFQTIGNHDHEFDKHDVSEQAADPNMNKRWEWPKSNFNAQRRYELNLGPVNYSFNRGMVHIISMDDIQHTATGTSNYCGGFYDWQWEWFQQDLAQMPEGYIPVLCIHMPFKDGFTNHTDKVGSHYTDFLELLGKYKGFVIAGHQHNHRWFDHSTKSGNVHEYILGTACGAWWHGTINTDGAPNGYGIFEFLGNQLVNEHYKGTKLDSGFQLRMHRAYTTDTYVWTAPSPSSTTYTFKWLNPSQTSVNLNIWNVYDNWKIEVYENGKLTKTLDAKNDKQTGYDVWAKRWFYETGEVKTSTNYANKYNHMFQFYLTDSSAKDVKIVATDGYGHKYEQTSFQTMGDWPDRYK